MSVCRSSTTKGGETYVQRSRAGKLAILDHLFHRIDRRFGYDHTLAMFIHFSEHRSQQVFEFRVALDGLLDAHSRQVVIELLQTGEFAGGDLKRDDQQVNPLFRSRHVAPAISAIRQVDCAGP